MIKKIFTKLLLTYVTIILVTLLVVGVFLSQLFQSYYFNMREKELISKGEEVADVLEGYMLGLQDEETTNDLLLMMDKFLDARVIAMDRQTLIFQTCEGFNKHLEQALRRSRRSNELLGGFTDGKYSG